MLGHGQSCSGRIGGGAENGDRCGVQTSCTLPPLVQATVNDEKLTGPTPSVAWTRVLFVCCNLRDTRVDMMYYSENQEVKHATYGPLGQQSCLDTKYELHASQNRGIRKHTWHTVERTTKINGAKN